MHGRLPIVHWGAHLGVHSILKQHFKSCSHQPFISPIHRSKPACTHIDSHVAPAGVSDSVELLLLLLRRSGAPIPRRPTTPPKMLPNVEARFFQHLCLTLHITSVTEGQSAEQPEALLFVAPTPVICARAVSMHAASQMCGVVLPCAYFN